MTALGYYIRKPAEKIRAVAPRLVSRDLRTLPTGRFVSICFDDFPKSAFTQAMPALARRNWKATWYVAGSMMGQDHSVHGRMFDAGDLKALRAARHDIGCHTFSHMDCAPASNAEVAEDLERNHAFFRKLHLPRARSFAFPFGRVDLSAKKLVMGRMPAIRGVRPGVHRGSVDRGLLQATGIEDYNGGVTLALNQLDTMKSDAAGLSFSRTTSRKRPARGAARQLISIVFSTPSTVPVRPSRQFRRCYRASKGRSAENPATAVHILRLAFRAIVHMS